MDRSVKETNTATARELSETSSAVPAPQGAGTVEQIINVPTTYGPGADGRASFLHGPSSKLSRSNEEEVISELDDNESSIFSQPKKKKKRESCVLCDREKAQEADHYPLNGCGYLISFNFKNFPNTNISSRNWSEHDYENLNRAFGQNGYDTSKHFEDYDYSKFFSKLDEIRQMKELSGCDVFILTIMSHGAGTDGLSFITSDDKSVSINEVCAHFDDVNCPRLKGKPKIFLACFCRTRNTSVDPVSPILENEAPETNPAVDHDSLEKIAANFSESTIDDLLTLGSENPSPELLADIFSRRSPEEVKLLKLMLKSIQNRYKGESNDEMNIDSQVGDENENVSESPVYCRKNCTDMIVMFSCQDGMQSVRKENRGVLFIHELCRSVEMYGRSRNVERIFADVEERMRKMCRPKDQDSLNGFDPDKKTAVFKTCYFFKKDGLQIFSQ